jgi:hypothetical protein
VLLASTLDPLALISRLDRQCDIGCFPFRYREATNMRMICNLIVATITFLVFFYSTTFAVSLMYALDSALLRF